MTSHSKTFVNYTVLECSYDFTFQKIRKLYRSRNIFMMPHFKKIRKLYRFRSKFKISVNGKSNQLFQILVQKL